MALCRHPDGSPVTDRADSLLAWEAQPVIGSDRLFTTPRQLVVSLILTWLIEWAVAAVILRRSDWRLAYNVLLINALTNPPAIAAAREFDVNFWLVEGLVFAVEVPLYRLL